MRTLRIVQVQGCLHVISYRSKKPSFVFSIAEPLRSLADALLKLVSGDFKGATEVMMSWPERIGQRWSAAWKSMVASSQEARTQLGNLFLDPTAITDRQAGGKRARGEDVTGGAKTKASPSFMSYYEAALEEERRLAAERDALHEYSKESELAFWRQLLAYADLSSKDRVDIQRKASKLEIDILRDKAKQMQALDDVAWASWRDAELNRIALDEEAARQQVALGQTTQEQLIQQEIVFEQRRQAVKLLALQNSLANLDPSKDPVKAAQINQQIEALEQQHQLALSTLRGRAAVESEARNKAMATSMEQGFAGVLARIGTTVRSLADLVRGLTQVVLQTFVQMLAQIGAKWLVNQLMMKIIGKATALGAIMTESAKAGAGGTASMAAAPFPLNLAAPAFGAAMAAAAAAYAPLASAAGGYDIPAGINPMVQTHAREMILPTRLSDTVRDMAQVYASSRAGGDGGGNQSVNMYMTVATPDADSFRKSSRQIEREQSIALDRVRRR